MMTDDDDNIVVSGSEYINDMLTISIAINMISPEVKPTISEIDEVIELTST